MTRAAHTHARISLSHTHARCATLHTTRPSKKSVITFEEWQTEHYEMTIKTSRRGVQTWTFALVRSGNPAGMRRWEVGCGESGRQIARVQHWGCEGQGRMRPIRARLCARFGGVQGHKATLPLSMFLCRSSGLSWKRDALISFRPWIPFHAPLLPALLPLRTKISP